MNGVIDQSGGSVLSSAVDMLQSTLLGVAADSVAIIAVAAIGFFMLSGRIPARRGATTIIGCFILFSAAAIANGLVGAMTARPFALVDSAPPAYAPSTPRPESSDPYAGASVPDQRTKDIFR